MPPRAFPTHFLCIPLVTPSSRPQLTQSLEAFTADVTNPATFGVPRDAVRPVGTLHLTLGVLSFPQGEGLEKATDLLKSLKLKDLLTGSVPEQQQQQQPGQSSSEPSLSPLTITLQGLASMQLPSKASTLYAPPVDQLGTLQGFCEKLRAVFQEAGLMIEENRPLLLHATILNTVYVRGQQRRHGGGRTGRGGRKEKLTIDASGILDRYEDEVWLENFKLEKIALCRMGAKKTVVDGVEDEAYEVEAEVDLRG